MAVHELSEKKASGYNEAEARIPQARQNTQWKSQWVKLVEERKKARRVNAHEIDLNLLRSLFG